MNNNSTTHTRLGILFFCLFLSFCANAQAPYCLPTYDRDCDAGDGFGTSISQFTLKRGTTTLISDATGCNLPNSYSHFITTTPSVSGGSSYSFDIAFARPDDGGGSPIAIDAGYAIWIDLNNNNTFENTEIVASSLACGYKVSAWQTLSAHLTRNGQLYRPPQYCECCGDLQQWFKWSIGTGLINVAAGSGGMSPYQYSKDGGMNYQSGNIITGLAAGNYDIKIKDVNNC